MTRGNALVPKPPSSIQNTARPSFQRRRHSSPEKTVEKSESPWIPIFLPSDVLIDVARSGNMLQMDTLGTKSTDLVFLEEHDNYLTLKVFNGSKFVFSDIVMGHSAGLLTSIQLAESFEQSQIPAIAIAAKDELLIYHRSSSVFSMKLDPVSISEVESEYWNQLWTYASSQDQSEFESVVNKIKDSRGNLLLSNQMQRFLSIASISLMQDYVKTNQVNTNIQIHISAIDALPKRETTDGFAPSIIVLGTLECEIYLLSPPKYIVSDRFQLSSAVLHLKCVGSYFGDFKIFALCMDGCVYLISRNICTEIIQCETNPVHFILSKNCIFLSFVDKSVKAYNYSGQEIYAINFSSPILHMESFHVEQKKVYGFMVALENKAVKIFNGTDVIFELNMADTILAFRFGQFKGEDMALVTIMKNQTLCVKVLKRSSSFTLDDRANKKVPFEFSKKSKAYIDCLKRERSDAKGIYDRFLRMELLSQVCLGRQRIPAYSSIPIAIDLNIELIGICSPFSLLLKTTNKSSNPAAHLILQIYPVSKAKLTPNIIKIPFLPSNSSCSTDGLLDCPEETKVIELSTRIVCKGRMQPIFSTLISLSLSEASSYQDREDKAATYAQQ